MNWMAAAGRYDRDKKTVLLGAVVTDGNANAVGSAMSTVNAGKQVPKLECGLMALELGASLAKANNMDTVAIWPGQSEAARSVSRSVGPGGTCQSGDYFRKDVRIIAREPDGDEKKPLADIMSGLEEIMAPDSGHSGEDACLANEVLEMYARTPDGRGIRDADTVLQDLIDNAEQEVTGIGPELIRIWMKSRDKESVESLFQLFTDCGFREYLEKCRKETTKP